VAGAGDAGCLVGLELAEGAPIFVSVVVVVVS
jgi:hypothetical protein